MHHICQEYVDFLKKSLKSIQFTEFATQWISMPYPVINTQRRKSLETYWTSHLLTRLATQWASLAVQTLPTCIFYVGCQFRWEQEAWGVAWKLQQICILKLLFHYVVKHFTKFPYLQWRHKVLRQARFSIIFRSETLPGLKKSYAFAKHSSVPKILTTVATICARDHFFRFTILILFGWTSTEAA